MKLGELWESYFRHYKKVLVLPFLVLLIGLVLIGLKYQADGDFVNRDITLKGGVALTILEEQSIDTASLEQSLQEILSPNEVSLRTLKGTGAQVGILIESDITELDQEKLDSIFSEVSAVTGNDIEREDYSLEHMGSALGESFFSQTIRAMIIAFIFMGIVVFIYFRSFIPSAAVILAALSDIIVTIAVLNLLDFKIGTAGIAALLMLIGYSIDTDIMLTTKVLKRKDETVHESIKSAFKTGMTMTLTTLAAVSVAFYFSESEVIRQIMSILFIGLVIDLLYTWVQNSGLLLWHTERKK